MADQGQQVPTVQLTGTIPLGRGLMPEELAEFKAKGREWSRLYKEKRRKEFSAEQVEERKLKNRQDRAPLPEGVLSADGRTLVSMENLELALLQGVLSKTAVRLFCVLLVTPNTGPITGKVTLKVSHSRCNTVPRCARYD